MVFTGQGVFIDWMEVFRSIKTVDSKNAFRTINEERLDSECVLPNRDKFW